MVPHSGEISKVEDVFEALEKASLVDPHHAHVRYWFRGHAKDEWVLQPGVYRSDFEPGGDEDKRLRKEQHLNQDFHVQSAGLLTGGEDQAKRYFLQQHYRMPTRLLDWTHNPLAALFFASSEKDDDHGAILMMDAYHLAPDQGKASKDFQGIATGRSEVFQGALKPIFEWKTKDLFPDFIVPVRPDHFDRRVAFQRSCFTFHVPNRPVLTRDHNHTLHSFQIPAAAKAKLRKQLSLLGITDFTVYGDLESLSRTLKQAHLG